MNNDGDITIFENQPSTETQKKYKKASANCQGQIRAVQNICWQQKSVEIPNFEDPRDMLCIFAITKEISASKCSTVSSRNGADDVFSMII